MTLVGLTATERAAYERALGTSALVRQEVNLYTLSHGFVASATPLALDGQVNYADGDGVARTLQMGFLDPDRSLRLDGDAPTEGIAGLNRLIQVRQHVYVDELSKWVGVNAFTGRPSQVDRDGDTVTVEAQGKECLHLRTVSPFTLAKGTYHLAAIRKCLTIGGETRFRFPTGITHRLARNVVVGGEEEEKWPWQAARWLARQMGMQLYYDGDGYACLRKPPTAPVWTITERGTGANILSRVKTTTSLTGIRNRVVVTGKTTSGKSLVVALNAPAADHHSAQTLAVNGVHWYDAAYYDQPDLHTTAAVTAYARARLAERLTQSVDVQTSAVPVWHLEPQDIIRLNAATSSTSFPLSEASVPLGPSDTGMTLGYQTRVRNPTAGRIIRRA